MKACESYSEAEGSDPDSVSDDLEEDPDFDITEETYSKFSNLSIEKNKAKTSTLYGEVSRMEIEPEEQKTEPDLDENDEKSFEKVQKIIEAKEWEKLKIPECKLYLRKNGLRLTGNKDTLIQRIREHLEIINGGGERKYPPSSFVQNCKGDACTGDVVLFEQNVYEMFSVVSRSASGSPCGKRIVAGRIVKESYGAAKQQHTFTIEVLWSKGEKPLSPLYPLLIKGRNLYRLKTLRQRWDDEGKRQKILVEKHSRGNVARVNREARIQEKEKRKTIRENRVSKKETSGNQSQSHPPMTKAQYQQEESRCINPVKPEFFVGQCEEVATKPHQFKEKLINNENQPSSDMTNRVAEWSFQHQEFRCINPAKPEFFFDPGGRVATRPHHFKEKLITTENYPCSDMTNRVAEWPYQHKESRFINPAKPEFFIGQGERVATRPHHLEKLITTENYPCNAMTNRFAEWPYHRKPLTNSNYLFPLTLNRESFQQKQPCKYYDQGRCRFGDNCKFSHGVRS
ncbi:hypothetical protein K1719_009074 [Acacia pycnantha]|nr:hypothetical protein K1719_009074 [Acacia pycnantha]